MILAQFTTKITTADSNPDDATLDAGCKALDDVLFESIKKLLTNECRKVGLSVSVTISEE